MSRALPLSVPCPVQLGSVKNNCVEAQLHEFVTQGNHVKVKKILKKGVCADTVNSLGQSALFTAALLGLAKLVDVLLDHGADPNHRCNDGSTPVHAAAFSGNNLILSKMVEAGGDLRLHDNDGRNPYAWALEAGKERSTQMVEFIQRCAAHMQALVQCFPYDLLPKVDSSQGLMCHPSIFGMNSQGNLASPLCKFLKCGLMSSKNIFSFGYGKLCFTGCRQLAYLASLPVIEEKEVVQADDEPTFSFSGGPHMTMTNLMWGGSRVTVKELKRTTHQNCSKLRFADLLIAEQEYMSKLRHPHLLQLMAVCVCQDLESTRLVYERVNFGSLYSILHERRSEFPVLHMETIVHLLLHVNDALMYLHTRGFLHRSLSSHAVQIVSAGFAKISNFEYMVESKGGGAHSDDTNYPVPVQLYNWTAPEVIMGKKGTIKSDVYSFCVIMQEVLTDTLPWADIECSVIKEAVCSGRYLAADLGLPKPHYDIVRIGLEGKPKDRTMTLQDIRYILKNDLKDMMESRRTGVTESLNVQRHNINPDINVCLAHRSESKREPQDPPPEKPPEIGFEYFVAGYESFQAQAAIDRENSNSHNLTTQVQEQDGFCSKLHRRKDQNDDTMSVSSCYVSTTDSSFTSESPHDALNELDRVLEEEIGKSSEVETGAETGDPHMREICVNSERSDVAESSGTETVTEAVHSTDEDSGPSEAEEFNTSSRETKSRLSVDSTMQQYISSCVLNNKISKTLMHHAEAALYSTEQKLRSSIEINMERHECIPSKWSSGRPSSEVSHDEVDNATNLFKSKSERSYAFSTAIGPPSRYMPPESRFHGAYSTAAKDTRKVQSEYVMSSSRESRSKVEKSWNVCKGTEQEKLGDQVETNDQLLLCNTWTRRKTHENVLCSSGDEERPLKSGAQAQTRLHTDGISKYDSTSNRTTDRRVVESVWTCEVKEMAEKAATGKLGIVPQYPQEEQDSGSDVENIEEVFQPVSTQDQKGHQWDETDHWQTTEWQSEQSEHSSGEGPTGGETDDGCSTDPEMEYEGLADKGKEMAGKETAKKFVIPAWYAQGDQDSGSDMEHIQEFFQDIPIRDQKDSCQRGDWQSDKSESTSGEGDGPVMTKRGDKTDLEKIFRSFADRRRSEQILLEETIASLQRTLVAGAGIQNPCGEKCSETDYTQDCSLDSSDEFHTPDPNPKSLCSGVKKPEPETLSSEDELELTKEICILKPCPAACSAISGDAEAGGKLLSCSTADKQNENIPAWVSRPSFTFVNSAGDAAKTVISASVPCVETKAFNGKDKSSIDIQELSSISCEREMPWKKALSKSPSTRHEPTSASTPVSQARKMGSNNPSTEHSEAPVFHSRTMDTSCWESQDSCLAISSPFATACENKSNISDEPHSSAMSLTSIQSINSVVCSPLTNATSGVPAPVTVHKDQQRASARFIDELPPPPQELLDEIENLKHNSATCLVPEMEDPYDLDIPVHTIGTYRKLRTSFHLRNPADGRMHGAPSGICVKTSMIVTSKKGDGLMSPLEDKAQECAGFEAREEQIKENGDKKKHQLRDREEQNEAEELAHSTLDEVLEQMLHPGAGRDLHEEELPEYTVREPSQKEQMAGEMNSKKQEETIVAESRKASRSAETTQGIVNEEDERLTMFQRLNWPQPYRVIFLDQNSPPK